MGPGSKCEKTTVWESKRTTFLQNELKNCGGGGILCSIACGNLHSKSSLASYNSDVREKSEILEKLILLGMGQGACNFTNTVL